jgi:alpha-L-fucosidase
MLAAVLVAASGIAPRAAEPAAAPAPASSPNAGTESRRWLEDAKFGLFVHWGVSALVGKGEWLMEQDRIPISEYEKLPPRFNPGEFDAERWARTVAEGGQKCLVVTVKQHDGFCLFESELTGYDIVDATPYAKDPIKDLSAACRRHGVRLFFYYSLLDWHHPDYFPRGQTGRHAGREDRGDWSKYVAYYQGQIRELCTRYGPIGGLILDGCWDRPDADWQLTATYKIVHDLQPGALVANNHHGPPQPGEDFQIVESDPPQPRPGGPVAVRPAALPRVVCRTIDPPAAAAVGGAISGAGDPPSPAAILHELLNAAGRGANLWMNVGPGPDGALGAALRERLLEAGKWLDHNGATVYGTRPGPVPPRPWGVSLVGPGAGGQGPGPIYLHVLNPDEPVRLPRSLLAYEATLEGKTEHLRPQAAGDEIVLPLPEKDRTPVDTIIVLRPEGSGR